jgi:Transport protein particle (TRAPP) component
MQQQQVSSNSSSAGTTTTTQVANVFWSKQPKANAELFALTYGSLVAELVKDYDYDVQKIQDELDRMGHSIGIRCIEEVLAKSATASLFAPSASTLIGGGIAVVANAGVGGTSAIDGTSVDISSSVANSGTGAAGIVTGTGTVASGGTSSNSPLTGPVVLSSTAQTFYESADLVKIAFRMFFGIVVDCSIVVIDPSITKQQQLTSSGTNMNSSSISLAYSIKFYDNPLTIFVELPEEFRSSSSSGLEYSQLLAGMVRGMLEMLQLDCNCYFASSVLNNNFHNNTNTSSITTTPVDYNEIRVELKQILQDGAGDEYHEE